MIISVFDRVEKIVGKGKIQKASFPDLSEGVIVWEWVKMSSANVFNLAQP